MGPRRFAPQLGPDRYTVAVVLPRNLQDRPQPEGASRLAVMLALGLAAVGCTEGQLLPVNSGLKWSPERLVFPETHVGDLSQEELILMPLGVPLLALGSITAEPPDVFVLAGPAPSAAPSAGAALRLGFAPSAVGLVEGRLVVQAPDTEQGSFLIPLAGRGVEGQLVTEDSAACEGAPRSFEFQTLDIGESAERSLTLTASGSASLEIVDLSLLPGSDRGFSVEPTDALPQTLSPGDAIVLRARYAPLSYGAHSATLLVQTEREDGVRLTLCGRASAAALCAEPLDFGDVPIQRARTEQLVLTSCGAEPLRIQNLALTDAPPMASSEAFSFVSPSGERTLLPGESLIVDVSVLLQQEGPAQAWLEVQSNATEQPRSIIEINAAGTPPCRVRLAPESLPFLGVPIGERMVRRALLVSDAGVECTIDQLSIAAGEEAFALVDPPRALSPGELRPIAIRYSPVQAQSSGALELRMPGYPVQTTALIGTSERPGQCRLEARPAALQMGAVRVDTTQQRSLTLHNRGGTDCRLSGVALAPNSSDFFSVTGAPGSIGAGESASLQVTYRPEAAGDHAGVLIVSSDDALAPTISVPLFGAGALRALCIEPRVLDFGPLAGTQNIELIACGAQEVTITGLEWSAPDDEFTITAPTLPARIASGDRIVIPARYTPVDGATDWASLVVRSTDPLAPEQTVDLSGGSLGPPPEAGSNLYYWQTNASSGTVFRTSLQSAGAPTVVWGAAGGQPCTGCHSVSPDGRYVAFMELAGQFRILDNNSGLEVASGLSGTIDYVSWNPDPNTNPPYQFVFSDDSAAIRKASISTGLISTLVPQNARMPSWSADGRIAYVRGAALDSFGFGGTTDIMIIPEEGGPPEPLVGASANGLANYYPKFSPNGRWIAFTQSVRAISTHAAGDAKLRLVRADQSGAVMTLDALNGQSANSYPSWSLDGRAISFSSNRTGGLGGWDIYVARTDPLTGMVAWVAPLTLANSPVFDHGAVWSP